MELRSHFLNKLTNVEVEQYLAENDAILVPVGTVEMHGGFPLDVETVVSEAFALKMAERANCLILPNLPYFYAGATASGRGTVEVSVEDGIHYLKAVTRSLLRQGFRRIIFLSLHGPAHMTCSPVVRDLGDETGAPLYYIDTTMVFAKYAKEVLAQLPAGSDDDPFAAFNDVFYAGYLLLDRLEDVPLTTSPELDFSAPHVQTTAQFNDLTDLAYQSGGISYFFAEPLDHAFTPVLRDAEDRLARAQRGAAIMDGLVEKMDVPHLMEQLKNVDNYNKEVLKSKGEWLHFWN